MMMDNPVIISRMTSMVTGEEIQIVQYGRDDYEATWTESKISVRGTLNFVLENVWEG
jgi:hypothetical protein